MRRYSNNSANPLLGLWVTLVLGQFNHTSVLVLSSFSSRNGGVSMDRLRPRNRPAFFGFTNAEIEKMEKVLKESGEESLGKEFCQRLTKSFNRSSGRAGKPVIKWTEIQHWFQTRLTESPEVAKNELTRTKGQSEEGGVSQDSLELEFEARSSKDGAWYDVEKFLNHRFLSTGEASASDLLDLELRKMSGSI